MQKLEVKLNMWASNREVRSGAHDKFSEVWRNMELRVEKLNLPKIWIHIHHTYLQYHDDGHGIICFGKNRLAMSTRQQLFY